MTRLRIGFTAPVFKNIAVFVVKLPDDAARKIIENVTAARVILTQYSPDVASRIVCEAS